MCIWEKRTIVPFIMNLVIYCYLALCGRKRTAIFTRRVTAMYNIPIHVILRATYVNNQFSDYILLLCRELNVQ